MDPRRLTAAALIGALAVLAAIGLVLAEAPGVAGGRRTALVVASAPLLLATFALATEEARRRVASGRGRLAVVVLVVAAQAAAAGRFDPYALAVVAAGSFAALEALARAPRTAWLTPADLAVWLLLWIPFDYRGTGALWAGPKEFAYAGPALAVTTLALAGWGGARDLKSLGWRPPIPRDLGYAGLALLGLGAIILPAGLGTGFLRVAQQAPDPSRVAGHALVNLLTVALPEEVYFRGVLDSGLRARWRNPWASLAASSLAFGLMHWNNETRLEKQVAYCAFAAIAGAFYGLAFRRSGGLPAAVLVHAATDVIWSAALKG